jgi:hypothetical protein
MKTLLALSGFFALAIAVDSFAFAVWAFLAW